MKGFTEGVDIISKYDESDEVHAEHDQIWFGEYLKVDNEEDRKRLEELGWFEDEDSWSCFC